MKGNDFDGEVFAGDMLPFFFEANGETFGDFFGDNFLLVEGFCGGGGFGGKGLIISLNNGEGDLDSLISVLGLGGDFFNVVGGEGGGGAAFRAGIVIGDGTFLGEKAGDIGDPSFKRLSSTKLFPTPFGLPFFAEPFRFPRFAGFFVIIFPLTTDTVTSSSPPGCVLSSSTLYESSEPLSKSGFDKGFGEGLGDTLGLENKGSGLGE